MRVISVVAVSTFLLLAKTAYIRPSTSNDSPELSSMSVLSKIAFFQNRRDEIPNQQLAKELAETENKKGIKEIA